MTESNIIFFAAPNYRAVSAGYIEAELSRLCGEGKLDMNLLNEWVLRRYQAELSNTKGWVEHGAPCPMCGHGWDGGDC